MLDDLRKIHERDTADALGLAEKQWHHHGDAEFLRTESRAWLPTVPAKTNIAKQIALECMGKSVIVYAGPAFEQASQHWKKGFNEHARQLAWVGVLSTSEFMGWTKQPHMKPYAVIELLSDLESAQTQQLFEISNRLLSGLRPEPIRIHVTGETVEDQLRWVNNLGDFVTIYAAILNGLDPTPVKDVEKFNNAMEV